MREQPTGEGHGEHGTDGAAEQGQTEGAGLGVERIFDLWDARDPGGFDEAVDEEEERDAEFAGLEGGGQHELLDSEAIWRVSLGCLSGFAWDGLGIRLGSVFEQK